MICRFMRLDIYNRADNMGAMICYAQRKHLPLALEHARRGGQALFLHRWLGSGAVPPPFQGSRLIGKLFDANEERLIATALSLGVRVIKIDRLNQPGQHIDLVGPVLERAIKQASALNR